MVKSTACWATCFVIDETNEVWFLTDLYHLPLYTDSLLAQLGGRCEVLFLLHLNAISGFCSLLESGLA